MNTYLYKPTVLRLSILIVLGATVSASLSARPLFAEDLAFLQEHTEVIVLERTNAAIAIVPAYQGRVMTSTFDADSGPSCGWINRPLIEEGIQAPEKRKGEFTDHIHVFGGEERIWFGPEGGQYSVFFSPGDPFEFNQWKTPAAIDTESFSVVKRSGSEVAFHHRSELVNWSGTRLSVEIKRSLKMLNRMETANTIGVKIGKDVEFVAYRSDNCIRNVGKEKWTKETGTLSIWLLGMFPPSEESTIVIPFAEGSEEDLGRIVKDDYFGKISDDRLRIGEGVVYMRADGAERGKIGLAKERSKGIAAGYDAKNQILTIVHTAPIRREDAVYVNSMWELQDDPYSGDAINAYNDGPPTPDSPPLGPFFELETSSPAGELEPGEELQHIQTTIHLSGSRQSLARIAQSVLGVSLNEVENAF